MFSSLINCWFIDAEKVNEEQIIISFLIPNNNEMNAPRRVQLHLIV